MKTPEEIKRGNVCCGINRSCDYCPYDDDCIDRLFKDNLDYIQQLEQDNAQKDERIGQLERERDGLLHDFKLYMERNINQKCGPYACDLCKRGGDYYELERIDCPKGCMGLSKWEWRGVEEGFDA